MYSRSKKTLLPCRNHVVAPVMDLQNAFSYTQLPPTSPLNASIRTQFSTGSAVWQCQQVATAQAIAASQLSPTFWQWQRAPEPQLLSTCTLHHILLHTSMEARKRETRHCIIPSVSRPYFPLGLVSTPSIATRHIGLTLAASGPITTPHGAVTLDWDKAYLNLSSLQTRYVNYFSHCLQVSHIKLYVGCTLGVSH